MPIIAENNGGGERVLIPAGNHIARCYEMIQIGTILETTGIYAGKEQQKVRIAWETPHECHDFGKGLQPFSVSKEFTLSMNEKATLRKMLEGWRGKAFTEEEAKRFDITKLLGLPCMISVIHKISKAGKPYAEISGIAGLPKGFECPAMVNPKRVLSFDAWDQTTFDSLPEYMKAKIRTSREYAKFSHPSTTETMVDPGDEPMFADSTADYSDLPF